MSREQTPTPIRVLLADDNLQYRTSLASNLERLAPDDIQIVGHAKDGQEAIDLSQELKPDLMLLDIEMPEYSGLDVMRILRSQGCDQRIMIVSGHCDAGFAVGSLECGALGYMLKEEPFEVCIQAIHLVSNGAVFLSKDIVAGILRFPGLSDSEMRRWIARASNIEFVGDRTRINNLSKRQLEILTLVADGKTNDQIAELVFVSPNTVRHHIENVMKILYIHSRTELIVFAWKTGIVFGLDGSET